MKRVITAINARCDVPGCGETFSLGDQGLLKVRAEWRRAKALGWRSTRLRGTTPVELTTPDDKLVRINAKGWFAICPRHPHLPLP